MASNRPASAVPRPGEYARVRTPVSIKETGTFKVLGVHGGVVQLASALVWEKPKVVLEKPVSDLEEVVPTDADLLGPHYFPYAKRVIDLVRSGLTFEQAVRRLPNVKTAPPEVIEVIRRMVEEARTGRAAFAQMVTRVARKKITEDTEIEFAGEFVKTEPIKAVQMDEPFEVETLEGTMKGKAGDWLAEGIEGERWPIDAAIFEKTYKEKKAALLRKLAAQVQTDTATLYVIAPEQLHRLIREGQWEELADAHWTRDGSPADPTKVMDRLIRLHGGAVFFMGRDGFYEITAPEAWREYGYINPKGRVAALAGTDTAELYVIAPEQLRHLIDNGRWKQLAESFWGGPGDRDRMSTEDAWKMMEDIIRQHGGAVFRTQGDGAWDVRVFPTGDYGQANAPEAEGQGFLQPYGVFRDASEHEAESKVEIGPVTRVAARFLAKYLNVPPTELARKLKTERDPKKRREMENALDAWRTTQGNPLAPEASSKTARTYSRIVMFDFDGTLFKSWEQTPQWWPDQRPYSFFLRPESLAEPCVPDRPPGDYWIDHAVAAAKEAGADPTTLTVLITGRVKTHEPRIAELLRQKGIRVDKMYFNPGMSAAKFKTRVLGMLLVSHPIVDRVEIWENENQTHYAEYLRAARTALGREDVKVSVFNIHEPPKPLVCGPEDFGIGEGQAHVARQKKAARGVGLFLPLPAGLAEQFPSLGAEDDSPPHVTLLYVGEVPAERRAEFVETVTKALGREAGPIRAYLDGLDYFVHPHANRRVYYNRVRFSKDVAEIRDRVWLALEDAGFEVKHSFPLAFFPHVTLAYAEGLEAPYTGPVPTGSWAFDKVAIWGLPKEIEVPLGSYVSGPAPSSVRVASRWNASRALR